MDTNTGKTNGTPSDQVELTPELKLLETRPQSKFDHSINTALEPIQKQLSKLASTSDVHTFCTSVRIAISKHSVCIKIQYAIR